MNRREFFPSSFFDMLLEEMSLNDISKKRRCSVTTSEKNLKQLIDDNVVSKKWKSGMWMYRRLTEKETSYSENREHDLQNKKGWYQKHKNEINVKSKAASKSRSKGERLKHPLKPWQDPESLFCDTGFLEKFLGKKPREGKECKDKG